MVPIISTLPPYPLKCIPSHRDNELGKVIFFSSVINRFRGHNCRFPYPWKEIKPPPKADRVNVDIAIFIIKKVYYKKLINKIIFI